MGFWVRKIIFGTVLIVIAFTLMNNLEFVASIDYEKWFADDAKTTTPINQSIEDDYSKTNVTAEKTEQASPKDKDKYNARVLKTDNAAAEGLSRFYAALNPELADGSGIRIRNGVVLLPDPTGDLEKILEARRRVIRPLPASWKGSKKNRPFRNDQTLYQKLAEYAKEDGLEVIWWLNKDLVIKDPFRINKGILPTAYQIGQALNGHFPGGVSTYFCYRQRNIVLIEGRHKYLDKNCHLLDYNRSY
jgi:hypothetical protein